MSILVEQETYEQGLVMVQHQLAQAIQTYESYLVTYGTVPSMILVSKLKTLCEQILEYDRTDGKKLLPHSISFGEVN